MKVTKLYSEPCIQCQNKTRQLLCHLCRRHLQVGPFEINSLTEAWFLGNETIMQLIRHYDRTGQRRALSPIVQKIIPLLPRQARVWIAPSDDYVLDALVKTIMDHDPAHAVTTRHRHGFRQIQLCRYPPKEPTQPTLCLMTH
ncbi:MAG: hypothetical protein ACO2YC_07850 [Litorivicinaceae bacterium]